MILTTPPFVLTFSKDERKVFSRIKYQFDPASVKGRPHLRLFSDAPLMLQYEISDYAIVIRSNCGRFYRRVDHHKPLLLPAHFDPFLPWAVARSPALFVS
jgi:hypothetical protein